MTVGTEVGVERALIKALQRMNARSTEYWDVIREWAVAIQPKQPGDPTDPVEIAIAIATRHNLGGEDDWECELQLYLAGCPEKYEIPFTLHWLVQHLTLCTDALDSGVLSDEEAER